MSKITVDTVEPATGTSLTLGASGDTITVPAGATLTNSGTMTNSGTATGFGKVLQVVSETKTDTQSVAGDIGWTTVIDLAITPSSTSSKVLLIANMSASADYRYSAFKAFRDSTGIAIGDSAGSRTPITTPISANSDEPSQSYVMRSTGFNFLDSPSTTSAVTYAVKVTSAIGSASYITYINRTPGDHDAVYTGRAVSTLTLMEIAG